MKDHESICNTEQCPARRNQAEKGEDWTKEKRWICNLSEENCESGQPAFKFCSQGSLNGLRVRINELRYQGIDGTGMVIVKREQWQEEIVERFLAQQKQQARGIEYYGKHFEKLQRVLPEILTDRSTEFVVTQIFVQNDQRFDMLLKWRLPRLNAEQEEFCISLDLSGWDGIALEVIAEQNEKLRLSAKRLLVRKGIFGEENA